MKLPNTLRVSTRSAWRAWLRKHHTSATEVWLLFYKRHIRRDIVEYEDAVCEALCFGWIDGMIRRVDDDTFARRFTPRRPGSEWSEINKRRVKKMIEQKKMTPTGLAAFAVPPRLNRRPHIVATELDVPPTLTRALSKNKQARDNFAKFPPSAPHLPLLDHDRQEAGDARPADRRSRRTHREQREDAAQIARKGRFANRPYSSLSAATFPLADQGPSSSE